MKPSVTQLLLEWSAKRDRDVLDKIFPLVYDELKRLAASHLRRENAQHTLQPTALVHESYLRLVDQKQINFESRAQFFALAAKVMRNLLINHAEAKRAQKRGGENVKVDFDESEIAVPELNLDFLALEEALKKLEQLDAPKARIVELKFFGGLTNEETAEVVQKSVATVEREWTFARGWLFKTLNEK